jgi:hypothetical protein
MQQCALSMCLTPLLAAAVFVQLHGGVPPVEARSRFSSSYLQANPSLRATIALDCEGKKVSIRWSYSATGDFSASETAIDQVVAVSYWPTCAEVVAVNTLLVAGKERSSDTRIERWVVAPPLVVHNFPSGGVTLTLQPLTEVEVVYDAGLVGRDMVKTMFRYRGKPSSALVQFHDSRSLYELDWGNEPYPLTLFLDAAVEPALTSTYDYSNSGNHSTSGYVYIFADLETYWSVPALVLFDTNRDGLIETRETMSFSAYSAARLDDRTAYIEINGINL